MTIKILQTRIKELKDKLKLINLSIRDSLEDKKKIEKELTELNLKINFLSKDLLVSEHALLRYIERILKIDIKEIESLILNNETKEIVKTFGDGTYPLTINNVNLKIVVKNNIIITIEV